MKQVLELEVGDKVIIRKDLKDDTYYGDVRFEGSGGMDKYLGTTHTVEDLRLDFYHLSDDEYWAWSREMFDWEATCKANGWEDEDVAKSKNKEEKLDLKSAITDFGIRRIFHSKDRDTIVFKFLDGYIVKIKRAHNDRRDDKTALVYAVIYHQFKDQNKSDVKKYLDKILETKEDGK